MDEEKPGAAPVEQPSDNSGQAVNEVAQDLEAEKPEGELAELPPSEEKAGDDESPSPDDDTEADEDRPKRPSHVQRLKRQRDRARQEADKVAEENDTLRSEVDMLRRQSGGQQQHPQSQQRDQRVDYDPEPHIDEYNNSIDPAGLHKLAHDQWRVRQAERSRAHEATVNRARQNADDLDSEYKQALMAEHQTRVAKAISEDPSFKAALDKVGNTHVAQHVHDAVIDSEISDKLVKYFAFNPQELNNLNRLGSAEVVRRVGRIEGQILSRQTPNKITRAPTPIRPPSGGGASPPTDIRKLADADDITAYARARDKKAGAKS